MKTFELHFNPKEKEDTIFDSFCYEPINIEEKRLGNLYMAGELKNALPQNYKLLEELAFEIKKEYYRDSKRSPEKSLIESLRIGNKFLENLTKEGNVNWLGNLNFAVLCLKDFNFHFTKVEDISAFLLRGGQITDIAKDLAQEEIEPYPLRVFGNIVSGKLVQDDIVLILTKEICEIFSQENLLNELANLPLFTEKKLKESLEKREKILKEVSGIAVLLSITEDKPFLKERIPELLEFERIKEKFSFIEALSPIKTLILKIIHIFKLPSLPTLKIPKVRLPKFAFPKFQFEKVIKNVILVLSFVIVLVIGFYLFQFQEKREIAEIEDQFAKILSTTQDAEKFLILAKEKEARTSFLEVWQEISSLEKILPENEMDSDLKKEISSLKEKVESSLLKLSNLIEVKEPEILFDFSQTQFVPQKMVILDGKIYFFNPFSQNIFWVDINRKSGEEIKSDKKFNFGQPFTADSIIFFAKPDTFYQFTIPFSEFSENKIQFSGDFDFIDFKKFYSILYLLDKNGGEILKCSLQECEPWLSKDSSKKPQNAVSFAVDGSIWTLDKNGAIEHYYAGKYQETLKSDVFPTLEKPTKISIPSGLPYFFILEPTKNRILIMAKSGEIYKQFQSDKFDNLKDFSVSEDGKTIYLLNGLVLYQVKL
jgi:hypothetical protein